MNTDDSKKNFTLRRALFGVLTAVPLILLALIVYHYSSLVLRIRYRLLISVLVCAAFALGAVKLPGFLKRAGAAVLALYAIIISFLLCWGVFYASGGYRCPDVSDKSGAFAGKNVMLIVPHEDDELNVLGGVFEQFISYGSELRVVFLTTGDYTGVYEGLGRMSEAVNILTGMGLPEENVIFLGYSDSMSSNNGYFYDLPDENEQVYSVDRSVSATYGFSGHPAYNDGNSFSRAHAAADMKACILEYRPDLIFCVDHDGHRDHRATSLIFESVMGSILSEEPDYRPLVLKGFAYCTGYYAPSDFYGSVNILSTVNSSGGEYMADNSAYLWEERLRLPVGAENLSRSLFGCGVWESAVQYGTVQCPYLYAQNFLNGDKVFWPRSTQSLTYSASVTASSGRASLLSDFRLGDNYNSNSDAPLLDGAWVPSADDAEPRITVTLPSPSDVSLIRLYDALSLKDNILKLSVSFDSGKVYEAGPLAPNGSATDIAVDEKNVSSFTVAIEAREGAAAGLTELEAYSSAPESGLKFIKLTDAEDNFVYDYITNPSGEELFSLYAVGAPAELSAENYSVSCSNERCSAELEGGALRVSCPKGEATVLRVESADGSLSDSVCVRNPRFSAASFWMQFESHVIYPLYKNSAVANLLRMIF